MRYARFILLGLVALAIAALWSEGGEPSSASELSANAQRIFRAPFVASNFQKTSGQFWYCPDPSHPYGSGIHCAYDLKAPATTSAGTEVVATLPGLAFVHHGNCGPGGGWGNYVEVRHGNLDGGYYTTFYAHLKDFRIPDIRGGFRIQTPGVVIGIMGDCGTAVGRHLHFETHNKNGYGLAVNPGDPTYCSSSSMWIGCPKADPWGIYSWPGDLNHDLSVDVFDFSILLSYWRATNNLADLNGSGRVDVFDLSILLGNWDRPPTGSAAMSSAGPTGQVAASSGTGATIEVGGPFLDGDDVHVPIYASGSGFDPHVGFNIHLSWDPAVFGFGSVSEEGGLYQDETCPEAIVDADGGGVSFACASSEAIEGSGAGLLATIILEPQTPGCSPLDLVTLGALDDDSKLTVTVDAADKTAQANPLVSTSMNELGLPCSPPPHDWDGDTVPDDSDNCPAWANPSQTLPAWPVSGDDLDCDGFTASEEAWADTLLVTPCSATDLVDDEDPDAWPADFDDNQVINILDFLQLTPPVFGTSPPDPNYSARKDLNADGTINILDIFRMTPPVFGTSCTP